MLRAALATAVFIGGAMFGLSSEARAQGLVPCARENGFCRVPYSTRVIYGIPGRSAEVFVREGGIPCSNRVFGDPAPGSVKRCSYVARGADRGPRRYDEGRRGYEEGRRGYDDGYRRSFREYERGPRDYDDGYDRPFRSYEVY